MLKLSLLTLQTLLLIFYTLLAFILQNVLVNLVLGVAWGILFTLTILYVIK